MLHVKFDDASVNLSTCKPKHRNNDNLTKNNIFSKRNECEIRVKLR